MPKVLVTGISMFLVSSIKPPPCQEDQAQKKVLFVSPHSFSMVLVSFLSQTVSFSEALSRKLNLKLFVLFSRD